MLSDVNGAKSLTSVKLSSLNIAKPRLTTEVFPDDSQTLLHSQEGPARVAGALLSGKNSLAIVSHAQPNRAFDIGWY